MLEPAEEVGCDAMDDEEGAVNSVPEFMRSCADLEEIKCVLKPPIATTNFSFEDFR